MKKEYVEYENYKYELFHTLMKCDYKLLDDITQKYKKMLGKEFVEEWVNADDKTKKLTYYSLVKKIPSSMEVIKYAEKLKKEVEYDKQ
jgi:hypothetical protein